MASQTRYGLKQNKFLKKKKKGKKFIYLAASDLSCGTQA